MELKYLDRLREFRKTSDGRIEDIEIMFVGNSNSIPVIRSLIYGKGDLRYSNIHRKGSKSYDERLEALRIKDGEE